MSKIILILALLVILFFISVESKAEISDDEAIWQAMHMIDVMQTIEIAHSDYHAEGENLTNFLISSHPNDTQVYAWGIGSAVAHYFIFKHIDKHSKYARRIRVIDNFYKLSFIVGNHQAGIRISF